MKLNPTPIGFLMKEKDSRTMFIDYCASVSLALFKTYSMIQVNQVRFLHHNKDSEIEELFNNVTWRTVDQRIGRILTTVGAKLIRLEMFFQNNQEMRSPRRITASRGSNLMIV